MGMPLAFDAEAADFSAMTAEERLFISAVVHQANITVTEEGTEAAATTAVTFAAGAEMEEEPPPEVHVDRPFFFAVRDTGSRAILFLGRVVDPGA
jgi:serpin B